MPPLLLQVRDERPLRVCWCGAPEGCLETQSFEVWLVSTVRQNHVGPLAPRHPWRRLLGSALNIQGKHRGAKATSGTGWNYLRRSRKRKVNGNHADVLRSFWLPFFSAVSASPLKGLTPTQSSYYHLSFVVVFK